MLVSAKVLGKSKVKATLPAHTPHVLVSSSSTSYTGKFARYLLQPRATLSRSVRWVRNETIRRSFVTATRGGSAGSGNEPPRHENTSAKDLPLYRSSPSLFFFFRYHLTHRTREIDISMDTHTHKMVPAPTRSRGPPPRRNPIPAQTIRFFASCGEGGACG